MQKEKVPLLVIYSSNGKIHAKMTNDANIYKLYGFLEIYLTNLRQDLLSLAEDTKEARK